MLTSCGGGGDVNFNVPPVSTIPPVSNTNFEERERFSEEVPVVNHTQFNLTSKNGEITITGVPGANSVMITGVKRVQSESAQDAKEQLQALKVNVQDLTNEVRVDTDQPLDTRGRKYIVDYTITVPRFLKIRVNNMNGNVTLASIDNDVTVTNFNGNVTLRKILGSALIDLFNGTIVGEVNLPLNGVINMKTLNGNIDLSVPASTSAELSATVSSGNISVSNLVLQNEDKTSTSLSGTLGSGQGTITLKTEQFGNINLTGL